jgi:hypothetical protein
MVSLADEIAFGHDLAACRCEEVLEDTVGAARANDGERRLIDAVRRGSIAQMANDLVATSCLGSNADHMHQICGEATGRGDNQMNEAGEINHFSEAGCLLRSYVDRIGSLQGDRRGRQPGSVDERLALGLSAYSKRSLGRFVE